MSIYAHDLQDKVSIEFPAPEANSNFYLKQDIALRLLKENPKDNSFYYGHADYTGKIGTTRNIQRLDFFQPFFTKEK